MGLIARELGDMNNTNKDSGTLQYSSSLRRARGQWWRSKRHHPSIM